MDSFWIIATASLVALSCSFLGVWLILRKMAMLGDAISHAVLPGIVIAFLIYGSRDNSIMLLGAGIIGVFTTFLIEFFHKKAGVQSDASIGVTFTWLFALGVILVSALAGQVDLDQECVLYGEIAYVPLEKTYTLLGYDIGPHTFWLMFIVLMINILVIGIFYKEFYLTTFDTEYAFAIGMSSWVWHYVLMSLVSFTTVASFESVGAILVVAFIVAPAASAYLISRQLKQMLLLAAVFGLSASVLGYYLAYWIDGSIAGAISSVLGIQFILVFIIHLIVRKSNVKNSNYLEKELLSQKAN
ncbi:metal ABC transporter permease [Hyphobacterium sp. CCMP332]|nr:metal ABC transporter permease [Hyphobacterium sp. CCMP332]